MLFHFINKKKNPVQILVVKFASMCGATVTKLWRPNVTHVIAAIDAQGACTRTLKVLMALLNGRWILKIDCKLYLRLLFYWFVLALGDHIEEIIYAFLFFSYAYSCFCVVIIHLNGRFV
jgi:hypothetical protein